MSYTKGGWKRDKWGHVVDAKCNNVRFKALTLAMNEDEEAEANTQLISAAPDLLEALKSMVRSFEGTFDRNGDSAAKVAFNKAQQAINKANGSV